MGKSHEKSGFPWGFLRLDWRIEGNLVKIGGLGCFLGLFFGEKMVCPFGEYGERYTGDTHVDDYSQKITVLIGQDDDKP